MTGLTLVVLAAMAAAPGHVAAEQQPAPGDDVRIVAVDTSAFPDVVATVALPQRARDGDGAAVNLTVASSGAVLPAKVEQLAADRQTVAVLLDTATGTDQPTLLAEQGDAAEFIRELDPATPIVIGTSTAGVLFGPHADPEGALAALGQLAVGGDQNWPQTLAATLAASGSGTPATIVVVSAVPPTVQQPTPTGLIDNLSDNAVSVRWMSLQDDARPSGDLVGIQSVTSTTVDGLLVRLDSIAAELSAQYRLSFTVDPRATSATFTLVADGATFTATTPLPVPSPAFIPPATTTPPPVATTQPTTPSTVQPGLTATLPATTVAPVVAAQAPGSEAATPSQPEQRQPTTTVTHRIRNFVATNWLLLSAGVAALAMLVGLLSVVTDRSTTSKTRRA